MKHWLQRNAVPLRLAVGSGAAAAAVGLLGLGIALWSGCWIPVNRLELWIVFVAGVPMATLVVAATSFATAVSVLAPIRDMAARARRLSTKTLKARMPVPNPQDDLGQLATGFNEILEQLEASFAELVRFTADVSHELRTPLTAMRTVGEVALRDRNAATLQDAVGSMLEQIGRMNQLIDRLLLLARSDSDELTPRFEAGLVRDALVDVSEALALVAEEKQQRIEVVCPDHLLAVFDPGLLRLALVNLLQNAIRFSPPGKSVKLRAFDEMSSVAIEVTDEGPGIAPEHQQKIFERFYRVDKARSRAEGGVGLGLAIVKASVERMGGTVDVKSELGRGSAFVVSLRRVDV